MCYFECIIFACGDWKWGNFKYHCTHEYRIGETCGLKFVAYNQQENFQCRICDRIDTKLRRRAQEVTRLELWAKEGRLEHLPASVEKSHNTISVLDHEISLLREEKEQRYNDVNGAARRAR
jgi:hypothetical protein